MFLNALIQETKKTARLFPAETVVCVGLALLFPALVYWDEFQGGLSAGILDPYLAMVLLIPALVLGIFASSLHYHLGGQDAGDRLVQTFFLFLGTVAGTIYLSGYISSESGYISSEIVYAEKVATTLGIAGVLLVALIPGCSRLAGTQARRVRRSLALTVVGFIAFALIAAVGTEYLVHLLDRRYGRFNLASYAAYWTAYGVVLLPFPFIFLITFRMLLRRKGGWSTPVEL